MNKEIKIKLKDAVEILKAKYQNEYGDNIEVELDLYGRMHDYGRDWAGDYDFYYTYEIFAKIGFDSKLGNITVRNYITKTNKELEEDLVEEIMKYCDENQSVKVKLPVFSKEKINMDEFLTISYLNRVKSLRKI